MASRLEVRVTRLETMAKTVALEEKPDINVILRQHDQLLIFADWLRGADLRPYWITTPEEEEYLLGQFPGHNRGKPALVEPNV